MTSTKKVTTRDNVLFSIKEMMRNLRLMVMRHRLLILKLMSMLRNNSMVTTHGSGEIVANKRRFPSERTTKLKLRKRVVTKDGSGGSHVNLL
ncbi:hypothetical protein LXL04_025418 [Taraxacum kok-saghyz]